jgi:hypothetical protein
MTQKPQKIKINFNALDERKNGGRYKLPPLAVSSFLCVFDFIAFFKNAVFIGTFYP